ncbi:MAG TPA: hypothetical protein VJM32_07110 [Candidatus Saccharimonadales bacterium]|nr:hypothetical protein [Candidatus Saccharimonadales bacterium]
MSNAAYDKLIASLGIDEDKLIDEKELEQITRVVRLMSLKAAQVAKSNNTSDTLAILQAANTALDLVLDMTPQQARVYNAAVSSGQNASLPSMSNGHSAPLALGSSTSTADSSVSPARAALNQQFTELDDHAAQVTIVFATRVGTMPAINALAITYILDGNRDWRITDDGAGQPVLVALKTARDAAERLRLKVRALADQADIVGDRNNNMVPSIKRLQDSLDDAWIPAPGHTSDRNPGGPNPVHLDELLVETQKLKDAARDARRA